MKVPNKKHTKQTLPLTVLAGTLLLAGANAASADTVTNPPPKKVWDSVAAASLTLTRGNSKSFLAGASIDTHAKWASDEALLGASAGYGDTTTKTKVGTNTVTTTTTTANYYKGYGQWNHLFTDRLYAGLRIEGLHDEVADIKYRFTVSPMAGYYFIKHTNTTFAGEAGPTWVLQKLDDDPTKGYIAERVAERFQHKFPSGAKIWESVEWISQATEFDNWFINAEAGVSATMSKSLSLQLVADDTFNNRPAPGRLKNDLKLLAGIGYHF